MSFLAGFKSNLTLNDSLILSEEQINQNTGVISKQSSIFISKCRFEKFKKSALKSFKQLF